MISISIVRVGLSWTIVPLLLFFVMLDSSSVLFFLLSRSIFIPQSFSSPSIYPTPDLLLEYSDVCLSFLISLSKTFKHLGTDRIPNGEGCASLLGSRLLHPTLLRFPLFCKYFLHSLVDISDTGFGRLRSSSCKY